MSRAAAFASSVVALLVASADAADVYPGLTGMPWDAESSPPLTSGAVPWSWVPLPDTQAVALDGTQYGLVTCIGSGPLTSFILNIQGGGALLCLTVTALGGWSAVCSIVRRGWALTPAIV